jgi:peroxiredoxin
MPLVGVANRANFVIGQDGKITQIVEGGDAVDPNAAIAACPLRRKG